VGERRDGDFSARDGDDGLTLANLSKLYRYPTLARALRISPKELLALIAMGADPFEPTRPSPARPRDGPRKM